MNTMVKFSLCTLSNEELVKKVDKLTDEMFQKQEVPTRNIPAEPNNDYDLLVGELLIRFSNQVQAVVKPACEIGRPQFRDYLPADTTTQMISDIFLRNKELHSYVVALDEYIDELESKSV